MSGTFVQELGRKDLQSFHVDCAPVMKWTASRCQFVFDSFIKSRVSFADTRNLNVNRRRMLMQHFWMNQRELELRLILSLFRAELTEHFEKQQIGSVRIVAPHILNVTPDQTARKFDFAWIRLLCRSTKVVDEGSSDGERYLAVVVSEGGASAFVVPKHDDTASGGTVTSDDRHVSRCFGRQKKAV
jgi:hypothetical protein